MTLLRVIMSSPRIYSIRVTAIGCDQSRKDWRNCRTTLHVSDYAKDYFGTVLLYNNLSFPEKKYGVHAAKPGSETLKARLPSASFRRSISGCASAR